MKTLKNPRVIVGLGKTGLSCVRYLSENKTDPLLVMDNRANPPGLEELRANYPQVPVHIGAFTAPQAQALLENAKDIIISPGLSKNDLAFDVCREKGIHLIGDIELFVRKVTAPIIAITGSNAKGTVTTWIGEMARAAGIKAVVGGNIGTPALDLLINNDDAELFILELSSFQLETTHSLHAKAAVILNVSPDHLDRYNSYQDYAAAKQRIYQQCEIAVSNREDALTVPHYSTHAAHLTFGLTAPQSAQEFGIITLANGETWLAEGEELIFPTHELRVQGQHNWANALAAMALAKSIHLPRDAIIKALREFKGLQHRCEWVADHNQVRWYNDSKGTNVGATQAAIEGLGPTQKGKLILIAGGQGKGADFSELKFAVTRYVKAVILMGEDAKLIEQALFDSVPCQFVNSMEEAVKSCAQLALPGDAVLLSPACASWDMFNNYEHRGEIFVECVKKILGSKSG